jgi:type IV secretory pathway TrbD component
MITHGHMRATRFQLRSAGPDSIGGEGVLHVVHPSLWRPILFGGADPGIVIAEVATVLALLFVVGLHVATVALALAYSTIVHAAAVWVTAKDAAIASIYLRSLSPRDVCAPIARTSAAPAFVRPAVPRIR